jgi:TonB family protein
MMANGVAMRSGISVIGIILLLGSAAGRARGQTAAGAPAVSSPAAATAEERVVLEALAAKMADAVAQSKLASAAVLDFADADGKVTPLGQKLADEFSDALAKAAVKFTVKPRQQTAAWKSTLFYYGTRDVGLQEARELDADVAVFGSVAVEDGEVKLNVMPQPANKGGNLGTFVAQMALSGELRALAESASEPNPEASVVSRNAAHTLPKCDYCPRPGSSKQDPRVGVHGFVNLSAVVDVDGRARDITVQKPLGYGLDEKAIETVLQWRFKPATDAGGQPVACRVPIEIAFN